MEKITCELTKEEAYAAAEYIDLDIPLDDQEWNSIPRCRNLLRAFQKMCEVSGYVHQFKPGQNGKK